MTAPTRIEEAVARVVRAHSSQFSAEFQFRTRVESRGVTVTFTYPRPHGGDPWESETYFGSYDMTPEEFEEYVHCGVHGMMAAAMNRWGWVKRNLPAARSSLLSDPA